MALDGKLALVTGGNRGIGFAIAEALSQAGARVCITGRDQAALEKAVVRLGANAFAIRMDVRDEKSVEDALAEVKSNFADLDILVNNAGAAGALAPVAEIKSSDWEQAIDTNLSGLMRVTRAALPQMIDKGIIVNTISVAATSPFVGMAAYAASKGGALAFTNVLREELRPRGVRVVALMPGAVSTDIWEQFWPDAPRANMLQPDAVGRLVAHLCTLPPEATVDTVHIGPASGTL